MNKRDYVINPAQTNLELYQQMLDNQYSEEDVCLINSAYLFTLPKVHSLARGSGKPFICHLVGTASLLVTTKASIEVVLAALMHALYQNRVPFDNFLAIEKRQEIVKKLFGEKVERLIDEYTQFENFALNDINLGNPDLVKDILSLHIADNLEDLIGNSIYFHGDCILDVNKKGSYLWRKARYLNEKEARIKILNYLQLEDWNPSYDYWLDEVRTLNLPRELKTGYVTSIFLG